jgi:hypothetical protein
MRWSRVYRMYLSLGAVVGAGLIVVALARGQYLWAIAGALASATCLGRLLMGTHARVKVLPNESQISRFLRQRQERRR